MKKRFRFIAIVMTMVMAMSFTAPSAALAYYHYYRPHYHHHHHWSSGRALAWGLGLAGLAWLAHKNSNRSYDSAYYPQTAYSYESARSQFINKLDDEEAGLFIMLDRLKPNEPGKMYRYYYGNKDVTKRRLKKIMKALPSEYQFGGTGNGYVFFTKLQ